MVDEISNPRRLRDEWLVPTELECIEDQFVPLWTTENGLEQPSSNCLLCSNTGGFDVEVCNPLYPQFVQGTASNRVWMYDRQKNAEEVWEKILWHDPLVHSNPVQYNATLTPRNRLVPTPSVWSRENSSSPSIGGLKPKMVPQSPRDNSQPVVGTTRVTQQPYTVAFQSAVVKFVMSKHERKIRRRWPTVAKYKHTSITPVSKDIYFYVGESRNRTRHGWGKLTSNNRVLYEGMYIKGKCKGWYLAFHEYHVEMGFQCNWFRVGVHILPDSNANIIPFTVERTPTKATKNFPLRTEQSIILPTSKCLYDDSFDDDDLTDDDYTPQRIHNHCKACPCRRASCPTLPPYMLTFDRTINLDQCTKQLPTQTTIEAHIRTLRNHQHHANFRARDVALWNSHQLATFLFACGAYIAAEIMRKYNINGSQIQTLTIEKLQAYGLKSTNSCKFVLTALRYLWNCIDWSDPLLPRPHQ